MSSPNANAVLVLDADMTPALAVVRSLGRHGLAVDVADANADGLARHSCHVRRYLHYPDPLLHPSEFASWLSEQIDSGIYALVIPVTERSATAAMPLLEQPGYRRFIALPERESLQLALDKDRTLGLARDLGIACPEGWLIRDEQELQRIAAADSYPLVIKPARSIGDNGDKRQQLSVAYAHNAEELIAKVRHYLLFGEVLVQQYINGDGVGIELIASNGEIILPFQHKRLHEIPLSGGGSSLRESVPLHPGMLQAARDLMKAMNWHGVAMVEFKHDPASDTFALMEINGRFWGSLPLSIAAGADFPVLLYRLLVDGECGPLPQVRQDIVARKLSTDRYWYELVLRREGNPALVRFPTKAQLLKDALLVFSPKHRFDVQQWRDWRPGWVDIKQIIGEQWQRVAGLLRLRRQRREQVRLWREWIDSGRLRDVKQILFLCYGNINRSAVAQKLFEKYRPDDETIALSAGFHEEERRPADPVMAAIAANNTVDLRGWKSSCVNADMVQSSDLVLVMEHSHREQLLQMYPQTGDKILLMGMLPGVDGSPEIADPYGQVAEIYRACFERLDRCTRQLIVGMERR